MKDTVLFKGIDNKEEIQVSALEIKEYANTEIEKIISDLKTNSSQNKQELETSIESLKTDIKNNKEAISQNGLSIVSMGESIKSLSNSLTSINDSISNEITNRQSGIEDAKTKLTALIDTKIKAEKDSRKLTEDAFRSQIEHESKCRQEADSELKSELLQEISNSLTAVDYATANKVLKQDLTSHIETVKTELKTEIKGFESRLGSFQTSLNEEIANRIKADNALQGNTQNSGSGDYKLNYEIMTIDHLDAGQITDDSIFLQSLNSADSYIKALQIKKYIDAPTNANFDNEVIERKTEDSKLAAKLKTETASRIDADNNLKSQIDSLDNRQTSAESILDTLTGTGEGSIKKSIADKIAEVVSNAPEAFDTLKEIADWVGEHEQDVLSMQTSISANASKIQKETDDRKNADSLIQLSVETEKSNRINTDKELKDSILLLNRGLEQEAVERENAKAYVYNSLKQDFENQITELTENKISDVVDGKLKEVALSVSLNTKNIGILDGKVSENKDKINTLNETVLSEKTDEKLLVSTESGTPQWQSLSSLIKSVNVDSRNINGNGNLLLNIPQNSKIVSFVNSPGGFDGLVTPFRSTNGNWYVHVSNGWGGYYGIRVNGTCYYIE